MRGRLPQLRGRRAPGREAPQPTAEQAAGPAPDDAPSTTAHAAAPTIAHAAGAVPGDAAPTIAHAAGAVPGDAATTAVLSPAAPSAELPADLPRPEAQAPEGPSFRDRGRYRRRLRYLRRVRELGFRDLGGLMHDLHRFGRDGTRLVEGKLAALDVVDRELRTLERALADQRPYTELREAGVAACPRCAALHATDARFCSSCGLGLRGPLAIGGVAAQPAAAAAAPPAPPAPRPGEAPPGAPTQTWFADPAQPGERPGP
jgi:hypothetical protein